MYSPTDTIAAVSTPMGEGGIGIVRLSGKDVLKIADKIFLAKDKGKPSGFKTYTIHYGWIVAGAQPRAKRSWGAGELGNNIIDEALLTIMRAPKSYTKEDVVEINCHGGIVPLREILDTVIKNGARLAEPGEFTLRAFLNGRIDLTQAESVLDIIRAKTEKALSISTSQLKGASSAQIQKIKQGLVSALSHIEAEIDFPEEDVEKYDRGRLDGDIAQIQQSLAAMLKQASSSRVFREGVSICIFGRPNVGKSSLLNALLKKERAIVTHIPGTTRDTIEEIMDIKGIPVKIIDTAGIIEPKDLLERKAVSRSKKYFKEADIILFVLDGSRPATIHDHKLIKRIKNRNTIIIINKSDLKQRLRLPKTDGLVALKVSALRKQGLGDLEQAITGIVLAGEVSLEHLTLMANARQTGLIEEALLSINNARDSLIKKRLSLEFIAVDLRRSLDYLGMILGDNLSEDVLKNIFSQFCIGK